MDFYFLFLFFFIFSDSLAGSFNPTPTLNALGLPPDGQIDDTFEDVIERIQNKTSQFNAGALNQLMNERFRQSGTTVLSSSEYFASDHGHQSSKAGLYEIFRDLNSTQPPSWWPDHGSFPSSPRCPLMGLKVVDLTRVIAGPTNTRALAEMGASVMRVTSPHVPGFTRAYHDLSWGKWNAFLHLKDDVDKENHRMLILEADVVVDGYHPGIMDRLGFGRDAIFELVKGRDRGIIHLRENCYGWHGPWCHWSGWQGISNAVGDFHKVAAPLWTNMYIYF